MGMCMSCRSEAAINGGKVERWQYQTVPEPCEKCGAEVSHERIH